MCVFCFFQSLLKECMVLWEPWLMVIMNDPGVRAGLELLKGWTEKHLVTGVCCWLWSSRFRWPGHRSVLVRHQHMQVRWGVSTTWEHGDMHLRLQGKTSGLSVLLFVFFVCFFGAFISFKVVLFPEPLPWTDSLAFFPSTETVCIRVILYFTVLVVLWEFDGLCIFFFACLNLKTPQKTKTPADAMC